MGRLDSRRTQLFLVYAVISQPGHVQGAVLEFNRQIQQIMLHLEDKAQLTRLGDAWLDRQQRGVQRAQTAAGLRADHDALARLPGAFQHRPDHR